MYQVENRLSGGEDKVEELDYTKKGYIFLKKIKKGEYRKCGITCKEQMLELQAKKEKEIPG